MNRKQRKNEKKDFDFLNAVRYGRRCKCALCGLLRKFLSKLALRFEVKFYCLYPAKRGIDSKKMSGKIQCVFRQKNILTIFAG